MSSKVTVTSRRLARYPVYLKYLKTLKENGYETVSSPIIAREMKCSEEQVRKDFQAITTSSGKPKLGRNINDLISDLETFLGYNDANEAILIGAGSLGSAFLNYEGFRKYGLSILACFDQDPEKIGRIVNGCQILPMEQLSSYITQHKIRIAILTVPGQAAQNVCDQLTSAGITGILNFAPVHLVIPEEVVFENVDMASSLAILSQKIKNRQKK